MILWIHHVADIVEENDRNDGEFNFAVLTLTSIVRDDLDVFSFTFSEGMSVF